MARSADAFLGTRSFNLSILTSDQQALGLHFAKPAPDKFERFEDQFDTSENRCPRLKDSVATFECSTYSRYQAGDHTILIGRVEHFTRSDKVPLLFHSGQMGSLWELAQRLARPE